MPTPNPSMPDPQIIAATLYARFRPEAWALGQLDRIRRQIAAGNDDGTVCPTCEGECTIPACTDLTCTCELDPPCAERSCPTCGGIGSV